MHLGAGRLLPVRGRSMVGVGGGGGGILGKRTEFSNRLPSSTELFSNALPSPINFFTLWKWPPIQLPWKLQIFYPQIVLNLTIYFIYRTVFTIYGWFNQFQFTLVTAYLPTFTKLIKNDPPKPSKILKMTPAKWPIPPPTTSPFIGEEDGRRMVQNHNHFIRLS